MGIVGQIVVWPVGRTPKGWLACDGAEFGANSAPQLWEVILQTYGSDGRSFAMVPSLGERRPLAAGQGPGLPDHHLGSSGDDSSADGGGGIGFVSMPSIILTEGTFPWNAGGGMLGTILPFAGPEVPRGWALCDGQLLAIADYGELYSVIGVLYGGDGRTTFALPDLRGRAPLGADDAHPLGQAGADTSVVGGYGFQAINYVTPLKPPPPGGGGDGPPMIGEIIYTATDFAPHGWALCQGQLLPINGNEALFELIGTTFGGDGDAFALPDLRGRLVIQTSGEIGASGSLSTGGEGQVAYLALEPMIAIEGTFPSLD